jgi:hypothetical protein
VATRFCCRSASFPVSTNGRDDGEPSQVFIDVRKIGRFAPNVMQQSEQRVKAALDFS